jgi:hypothetical protein
MRNFKLRNNAIVTENTTVDAYSCGGYTECYKVVDYGDMDDMTKEGLKTSDGRIVLLLSSTSAPKGGAHGYMFDIVEEVK